VDSAVQVLGIPEPPTQIQIRWPGGRMTTADIPRLARDIEVDWDGKIKVFR